MTERQHTDVESPTIQPAATFFQHNQVIQPVFATISNTFTEDTNSLSQVKYNATVRMSEIQIFTLQMK